MRLANALGRTLAERYPGRDYRVMMLAYGPSLPAPADTKPDGNVIVLHASNWFEDLQAGDPRSLVGTTWSREYADWAATGAQQWLRPNLPGLVGQYQGLPDVVFTRVMGYVRYVVERGATGIALPHLGNSWRTQGPLYYLLAQLAWNPDQDGNALLDDYHRRAFGPAATQLKAYWMLLEVTRDRMADDRLAARSHVIDNAFFANHNRAFGTFYDARFFAKASNLLDEADRAAAASPDAEKYLSRIAGVRTGLAYTRKLVEIRRLMDRYRSGQKAGPQDQLDTEDAARPTRQTSPSDEETGETIDGEQVAAQVRRLWDEVEAMIRSDQLLVGRSPYLWNRNLHPDPTYPYEGDGRRRSQPSR